MGETVQVWRPTVTDGWSEPVFELAWTIPNVLFVPGVVDDLAEAPHPGGDATEATFHFPRVWVETNPQATLRGCRIHYRGRVWEVEGEPHPYVGVNVPGPWVMPVRARQTQG